MNTTDPAAYDLARDGGRSAAMTKVTLLAIDFAQSALVKVLEDKVHETCYSAYGYNSPSGDETPSVLFNGQLKEAAQGHYLLGNGRRAFSPTLHRFVQPDPYSPFGKGGINRYAYSLGDPVNRHDPSGEASDPLVATAAVILVDALAELALGFILRYRNLWKKAIYNIRPTKHTVTAYREVMPGVVSFFDKHRGTRLNFSVHGEPGAVAVDDYILSASEFHYRLKEAGVDLLNNDRIRILSCYGANTAGNGRSFIQEFANISGKTVDGYFDQVYMLPNSEMSNIGMISGAGKQKVAIGEGRFGFGPYSYRPTSVKPQRIRRS